MPKITIFLSPEDIGIEKYLLFKKASFKISVLALAASGTVSLELAANRTPMVIGYDMNYLSRKIIQLMMRVDSVNLVNLITGNEIFLNALAKFKFGKPFRNGSSLLK